MISPDTPTQEPEFTLVLTKSEARLLTGIYSATMGDVVNDPIMTRAGLNIMLEAASASKSLMLKIAPLLKAIA